jgi:hypothetical protein
MSEGTMRDIAKIVERKLGKKYGFVVLAYEHGDSGRLNYVSNSNRADVVQAMKEFIAATEGNWGTHKL